MRLLQLVLRPLALVLSLPIIGMAAYEVHHHGPGGRPAIVGYILFCGLAGLAVSALGLATALFERLALPQIIADILAALFLLAGGIALAVQTGVSSCDPGDAGDRLANRLFSPPWIANGYTDGRSRWFRTLTSYGAFVSRCRMSKVTTAFLFFAWALVVASSVVTFRTWVKRRSAGRVSNGRVSNNV